MGSEILGFRDLEYLLQQAGSANINEIITSRITIQKYDDPRRKKTTYKLHINKEGWNPAAETTLLDENLESTGLLQEYTKYQEFDDNQFRIRIR